MNAPDIRLELLTEANLAAVRAIDRADISEAFVDGLDVIWDLNRYGEEHGCLGRAWAVYCGDNCIGVALLGEAIPWETDPPEMREQPFYRLMGFVIDRRYRGRGIGGAVLEQAIAECYREFGVRPVALGCHKDNTRAAAFYLRHGFRPANAMEGEDVYYLRYPEEG